MTKPTQADPIPLTLALLQSLGACWGAAALERASKLWPADANWTWFLGEHIAEMDRAEQELRVLVAFSVLTRFNFAVPHPRGVALRWMRTCTQEQFEPAAAALGAWMDALDETTHAALAAALTLG